ncbi:MAG: hypothetical protein NTX40_01700, partial [Planctomycetota bacterium]|nr:hypothetical protein [Planctomycetota bacterium]
WAAEEGTPRGEGRTGEARGGRTRAPEVKLTAEQETALAPAVTELKAAVAKFKTAATKTLGEKDGPAYVMQTIRGLMRAERPAAPAAEGGTAK